METLTTLLSSPSQILSMAGAALFMVFFFGFCVFIHELGHFLVARACGMHVIAFSIGFRKIWCKKIGGVEYRIGWLPFGGYVDLPQIDSTGEAKDENGNPLPKAGPWARIASAFAGPLFNILFGLLLGCLIWVYGVPQDTPKVREFKVFSITEGSPEYEAGLRPGDRIVKLNGNSFNIPWSGFVRDILLNIGDTRLEVVRDGKTLEIVYKPAVNKEYAPKDEIAYPFFRPEIPIVIFPTPGSAAEKAGLRKGDIVTKLNGRSMLDHYELESDIMEAQGKDLELTVLRNGKEFLIPVKPEPLRENGEEFYRIGIAFSSLVVGSVNPGMPAEGALQKGDEILALNGKKVVHDNELVQWIAESKGKPMVFTFRRDGAESEVTITPAKLYTIGVSYQIMSYPNPFQQFENVVVLTWKSLRGVLTGIKNKMGFTEQHTTLQAKHFSGPIGIGNILYISVYRGSFMLGIYLVVVITFNLGLMNLLPLPVLDGGHIMLAFYEMIFRRPMTEKVLKPLTIIFVTFLISFMLFVTFYDVKKLFGL